MDQRNLREKHKRMNILIKQATIGDSTSPFNGKVMDILIEKGIITLLKKTIVNEKNYKTIEADGLCAER